MITNYELRQRMSKVIRPNLQVLLVIALIAALPNLLSSTVVSLTGSDLTTYLYTSGVTTTATTEELLDAITAYSSSGKGTLSLAMSLWSALVSPVLTLGFIYAMLALLRGGTATVSTVFIRRSSFLRSVLLTLLIFLKLMLWALPGIVVTTACTVIAIFMHSGLLLMLASLGFLLMIVPMIMAMYRYLMAMYFLADEPETSALNCIRQSKAMMKGRKLQLFSLELPYMMGSILVTSLISALLSSVIGFTLSMLVQLIFNVYVFGARSAFYEAYSRPDGGMAHAFQADPYHDEMKE